MGVIDDRLMDGSLGNVVMEINGEIVELAELDDINAELEIKTNEYRAIGHLEDQEKEAGVKGSGKMKLKYGTRHFRNLVKTYLETRKMPLITINVTNEDPNFAGGLIKTKLVDVKIKKVTVASLDTSKPILDEEIPFSFRTFEDL